MQNRPSYGASRGLMEDSAPAARGAWLFGLVAIAGMGFIVFSKLLGYSQALVTAIPVGIMLLYAAILFFASGLRLRDDQSGDNLYYLGFLYTLTSLGVSLYQFSAHGGSEQIVTNFGIAIASTIVGLALRVAFNQMRSDPAEVERTARLELADAARKVRRELDDTVVELNSFRRSSVQSINEGYLELQKSTEEALESALKSIEQVAQRATTRIDESFETFIQHAEKLSKNSERTAVALEGVTERLEQIQAPDDLIVSKLTPAVESVEALVGEVRSANAEQTEQIRSVLEAASTAAETANKMGSAANEILAVGRSAADAADKTSRELSNSTSQITSRVKSDLETLTVLMTELSGALEKTVGQLGSIGEAQERISAAEAALVDAKRRQVDAVGEQGLEKAVDGVRKDIEVFSRELKGAISSIRESASSGRIVAHAEANKHGAIQPTSAAAVGEPKRGAVSILTNPFRRQPKVTIVRHDPQRSDSSSDQ